MKNLIRLKIFISQSANNNLIFFISNGILSAMTFTLIPIYGSVLFTIEIVAEKNNQIFYGRSFFVDDGLISILFIPILKDKEMYSVRRNNISFFLKDAYDKLSLASFNRREQINTRLCKEEYIDETFSQRW